MLQSVIRTIRKTTVPTFVSTQNARGTSISTVTVTAPTGIKDGHLLLAIFYASGAGTSSLPSGFTTAYTDNSAVVPRLSIGWKIAASESGNYTFTAASSTNLSAHILVYENAVFDVVGTINRVTSNTTATANSITTTSQGILIASFSSAAASPVISTPPSGMTLRGSSGASPNTYVYDETLTSSGSTGTRTLVFSTSMNTSGILVSLK